MDEKQEARSVAHTVWAPSAAADGAAAAEMLQLRWFHRRLSAANGFPMKVLTQNLPQRAVLAIGHVIAGWSHVEQVFDLIFTLFVIRDHQFELDDPRLLQLGAPFKRRVRQLRERLRELQSPNVDAWERALSRAGNLRDQRDIVAHGVWNVTVTDDPDGARFDQSRIHLVHKSYRNQKPHNFGAIRIATIEKRAEEMTQLCIDLRKLLSETPRGDGVAIA